MKWFLIVYIGMQSNYAVVDEYTTHTQCLQKLFTYEKALEQARSNVKAACVKNLVPTM